MQDRIGLRTAGALVSCCRAMVTRFGYAVLSFLNPLENVVLATSSRMQFRCSPAKAPLARSYEPARCATPLRLQSWV